MSLKDQIIKQHEEHLNNPTSSGSIKTTEFGQGEALVAQNTSNKFVTVQNKEVKAKDTNTLCYWIYFNLEEKEVYRVKKTEAKTFIQSIENIQDPVKSLTGWKEVSMPKIILKKGTADTTKPIYQKYDYHIAAFTAIFNKKRADGKISLWTDGNKSIPNDSVSSIPDLDVMIVKAVMMQESTCGTYTKNNAKSDIMQVNNGVNNYQDYSDYKAHYGLSKNTIPTPLISLKAGIKDLGTKGFKGGVTYDKKTGIQTYTFKGWNSAIDKYNGGGTKGYLESVKKFITNSVAPKPENYGEPYKE